MSAVSVTSGARPQRSAGSRVTERPPTAASKRHRAKTPEEFKTSVLNIRLREELKIEAAEALDRIGISMPEAIRVFLGRVVRDQAFPFPLEIPNAQTAAALNESLAADPKRYTSIDEMFDDLEKGSVS